MDRRWQMAAGVVRNFVFLAALAACIGCGSDAPTYDTTKDQGAINVLLVDLVDASSNPGLAERVFEKASLPKPADRAKYGKFNYSATETQIDGASAKMKVDIKDQQGTVVATKDWTATKADGTWKLQAAPLP